MSTEVNAANNEILDWDSELTKDGNEHIVLPEGDYPFTVTGFDRGRYPGGPKVPACNKATITLKIDTKDGAAFVTESLLLVRSLEWKISEFFRAIGLKKKGERVKMDWNHVVGSRGVAHIKPRKYKDKEGNEREANSVDHYLDFDYKNFPDTDEDGFMKMPEGAGDEFPFE